MLGLMTLAAQPLLEFANNSPSLSQAHGIVVLMTGKWHRILSIRIVSMEDPAPNHLWFDAIGSMAIIVALAVVFIVGNPEGRKGTKSSL